jgi:hypothetical protein
MLGMPAHTVLDDFPANAGLLLGGRITPYLPRLRALLRLPGEL